MRKARNRRIFMSTSSQNPYPEYPGTIIKYTRPRPYCCPVCHGNGKVPAGFYRQVSSQWYSGSSAAPEKCKSCDGRGVIWG